MIFVDKKVIDASSIDNNKVRELIYEKVYNNRSYCKWYVCDPLKHISEVKNMDNIRRYPDEEDSDFVYETGDDPVSDFLLENGVKMGEQVIFLCGW